MVVALAVIAVFGLLVTVHEFGHFALAKLNGVKVLEFNIGFGAPLVQRQAGETTYGIRSIPLGGYVRLAGMDDGETGPRSFNEKPVWRRLSIIAAGSITNLVLPVVLLVGVAAGDTGGPLTAAAVTSGSPAEIAGIHPGDQLVSINNNDLKTGAQLRSLITSSDGRLLQVGFRHPGEGLQQAIVRPTIQDGRYRLGVAPSGGSFDLLASIGDSVRLAWSLITATIGIFPILFTGHVPGGLGGPCGPSGPVGIVRATAAAASAGWQSLLYFAAFLSVNLGILNLLPLPALDGGRAAFLLVEAVRRRPIDPAKEQRVHYIGIVVLMSFIAFVTFNDLIRLQIPFDQLIKACQ